MLNTVMESNTVLVDTAAILNEHTSVCQLYFTVLLANSCSGLVSYVNESSFYGNLQKTSSKH